MKKFLLVLLILIVVLIAAVAIVLGFYLGPIVKLGMEQFGPKVTQTTINVEAVDVSLLSGSASIKGLIVGNPQGYSTAQAFKVGTVAVSLDPVSVTSQKILVRSVHVVSPEITYEGGFSTNNLSKISDNANSFVKNVVPPSANASSGNSNASPTPQASKPTPRIEVDDFLITGAIVHVNISGVFSKDVNLPDIHLTDLGKGSDGLTPAELTSAVIKAITKDTLTTVASTAGTIGKTLSATVNKFKSSLGGLLGN